MTDTLRPTPPVPAAPTPAEMAEPEPAHRVPERAITALWVAALVALAVLVWPTTLGGRASATIVAGTSMDPTYRTGDLALVRRTDDVAVGDVIVYAVPAGEPGEGRHVIHRVIGGDAASGWVTRGDNRDTPDIWRPRPDDVIGTVRLVVPQAGTWVLRALSPAGFGVAVAALAAWALWPRDGDEDEDEDDAELPDGGPPTP